MVRKLGLLAFIGWLFLAAGPLWADDGFYVVGGGGRVGTKITSLPYTITAPGYYCLAGNLSCSGSTNAITVNADNVTIDLMGFCLTGLGGTSPTAIGVYMNGRNSVEVRNGTITGFSYAINESSSIGASHRMIDIRAIKNQYGIYLYGNNHLIRGCTASHGSNGAGSGLVVDGPGAIRGCIVIGFNSSDGIKVGGGTVTGNLVANCTGADTSGIKTTGTVAISYNFVTNCTTGIRDSGGGNIIGNVVLTNSGLVGINIASSLPTLVDQNTVSGSGATFIWNPSTTVMGLNAY